MSRQQFRKGFIQRQGKDKTPVLIKVIKFCGRKLQLEWPVASKATPKKEEEKTKWYLIRMVKSQTEKHFFL